MQLHEASAKYAEHREQLNNKGLFHEDVWTPFHQIDDQGKVIYDLCLHANIDYDSRPSVADLEAYNEARRITKQRGGVRHFKTLDAVAAALLHIGQQNMPLWDVPLPDGL